MIQVIKWTHEADLIPFKKKIKDACRELHRALEGMEICMEDLGFSEEQIRKRLKDEFITTAREVIREES